FFFAGAFLPPFVALGGLYVSERLEDFKALVKSNKALLAIDPGYFKFFLTSWFFLFCLLLVLVFAGAGLIADDLKHSSLQLYFSRPLRKRDYLIGKMAVIAFFVLVLTALPYLVLVLFKLIFAGDLKFLAEYPWLPVSILGWSAVLTVFFAFYFLLLSASSRNTRYVTILIFTTYLFSDALAGIIHQIFRTPYMWLFSIRANLQQAGAFLFGVKLPFAFPAAWSFAVLAGVCALSAAVLSRRIRGVEVIK
ncbi:MAG: ABC transporter permease subunit, partial [Candidatus Aminicenantes bacterium]|nr:ABC transporter permease subunit [Candidatus Aminicenantes bacterium]